MTAHITHRLLAHLLNREDVFDVVAGAIVEARHHSPRADGDADSAAVLNHVIHVLRGDTNRTA